jgi:hypothetical protein
MASSIFRGLSGIMRGKIEKELIKKYRNEGMDLIDAINKGNQEANQIVTSRKLNFLNTKFNDTNILTDDYVKLIDEEIKLNDPELFQTIRQFEKNNRPALANKMRALRHPDWAEANFGEDYMTVLERGQTRELLNKIDPNIKERTILDDIDDMNKANIDELFGGRKRNADGGLAKILEV